MGNSKKKKSLVNVFELVDDYINATDWRVNEDSNKQYSLHGLSTHIASSVQARYWLDRVYPKKIRDAHINADFHIHDLGYLSTYCNGWDLKDLLVRGYTGVPGKVSCAPPKHLDSAFDQIFRFLYTVRHEAAGAQAISNVDTYLAPYIYYDGLSYKEVKQLIQKFIFNMNVPLDKGFQVPFTNITLDIKPSGSIAEEAVVIGGKSMQYKYGDFQKEMIMFNKAFAEVMIEGDAAGRVFTWPIPTYNITKDFPWENSDLDSIWEMTAKFGIPYFSNFINSDMSPDDVRSMCCRLRIDNRQLRKKGGGLFGANPLTGSIGVVTINLARIGYLAKGKKDYFSRLGKLMDLAKESLVIKRGVLNELTERGLYPYSRFYLQAVKDRFGSYWKNHFNTIGINGMNESCLNFLGRGNDLLSDKGQKFAQEVMEFMRKRLLGYQEEQDEIFNLEATPAEGATYRLAKKDKELYKDIIVANEEAVESMGAEPFYSNSTQLAVDATDDVFQALDAQDELQCMYTGGTVFHVFVGERLGSIESTRKLVKKISENYRLPYYSITPTFSICPKHGYLSGEHRYCPKCDKELDYERLLKEINDRDSSKRRSGVKKKSKKK
ncbi:ribonucleoside triphosphate reductase [Candidatus Dojkabacteria bacterium]|nr:ribonucleoside triphosphate reductase [Candidatus Dojkabacteria bacterium]